MTPADAALKLVAAISEASGRPMEADAVSFVESWTGARSIKLATEAGENALPGLVDFILSAPVADMLKTTCCVFPETSGVVTRGTVAALAVKLEESGTLLCPPDGVD